MKPAPGVERAFLDLEHASPVLQGLLRPLLVRALQDPAIMRQLGSAGLSQHLTALGQLLTSEPARSHGPALPPLETFLHLAAGKALEDVEEAYRFTKALDAPLGARVAAGLSRVVQQAPSRASLGTLSLLALARLLALAYADLPFVEYVRRGGTIDPFLPEVSPEPSSFVGELVEVVTLAEEQEDNEDGRVFVTIGRVLEASASHVVIETLREGDERPGGRLRLSMDHIVTLRPLSGASPSREFEAG